MQIAPVRRKRIRGRLAAHGKSVRGGILIVVVSFNRHFLL